MKDYHIFWGKSMEVGINWKGTEIDVNDLKWYSNRKRLTGGKKYGTYLYLRRAINRKDTTF